MTGIKRRLGSLLGPQGKAGTTAANARFDEIERKSDNAVTRVEHLETLGGLAPGEVTDAQTANLIHQTDSETRSAFSQTMATEITTEQTAGRSALENLIPQVVATSLETQGTQPNTVLTTILDSMGTQESGGPGALTPLRARLLVPESIPIPVVFAGSSTVAGTGVSANSNWARLVAKGHPLVVGYDEAMATGPEDEGLSFLNIGQGAQFSDTYISMDHVPVIGGWNPALVVHMIGSNDAFYREGDNGNATAVANNIAERIDGIDSYATLPVGHIIVHQHERNRDPGNAHDWDTYPPAFHRVAATRSNVTVLNIDEKFETLGVPGPDPLGMLLSDETHLTTLGHEVYANIIGEILDIPDYVPTLPPAPVLFDNFNRENRQLADTSPTEGTGTWENLNGSLHILDNQVVSLSGSGQTTVIDTGVLDMDLTVDVSFDGSARYSGLIFRAADANNWYYLMFRSVGIALQRQEAGQASTVAIHNVDIPAGDYTIQAKVRGQKITVTVDGIGAVEYTTFRDSIETDWTKVGFRISSESLTFDNLRITTPA